MSSHGPLGGWYRSHLGEPPEPDHVNGYWAFLLAALLALLGLVCFLVASTYERGADSFWLLRRIAFTLALVAGPLLVLSVVYLLPLQARAVWLALLGLLLCVGAAIAFNVFYPDNWNWGTADRSGLVMAGYGLGLGIQVLTAFLYPLVSDETAQPATEASASGGADAAGATSTDAADAEATADDAAVADAAAESEFEFGAVEDSDAEIEVFEDKSGKWRWRLRHTNGNVIADSGQGYADRRGLDDAVERLQSVAGEADTLEYDPAAFELYADEAGEWRWRLRFENGRILGDSGEGYAGRSNAREAVDRVRDRAAAPDGAEVYEDAEGEYRWRLEAANGEVIADSGQGYTRRGNAEDAVERLAEVAPDADTLDYQPAAFEIYQDRAEEWRWRLRHRNGRILGDSGEGYSSKSKARQGLRSVMTNAPNAPVSAVDS